MHLNMATDKQAILKIVYQGADFLYFNVKKKMECVSQLELSNIIKNYFYLYCPMASLQFSLIYFPHPP